MHPIRRSYTPADDDTNGFADDITGAGPFTPTATSPGDGLAHQVTITSTANLSGITFTLTGTDADDLAQTAVLVGPNNTTVASTEYFKTLTGVSASASLGANTADVGWNDVAVSPTIPLNNLAEYFAVSLGINISGTIDYTVQHCLDPIYDGVSPAAKHWWNHDSLAAQTADADGNYAFPVTAVRLLINSLTAGATAVFYVLQGG